MMEYYEDENVVEYRFPKIGTIKYDKKFDVNSIFQPERSKREDNRVLEAEFGNIQVVSTVLKSSIDAVL